MKPILSIIILNYKSKDYALEAILSIENTCSNEVVSGEYEVIVVDNNSNDGSLNSFHAYKNKTNIKQFVVIDAKVNNGFSAGNNIGIHYAKGKYILFLNPDTLIYNNTLQALVLFMEENPDAGACTCKLLTPANKIDEASHRGFPTPWNAFCHFSGLERFFGRTKLFGGYIQGWKDMRATHIVDAISGAFLFVRRKAGEEISWWDEDYFFYGEDLDFCYNLKKKHWNIYFLPFVSALHYGGISSGIKKRSQNITKASVETKIIVQNARFNAMRIFYNKYYLSVYPKWITWLVFKGINILNKKNLPKNI